MRFMGTASRSREAEGGVEKGGDVDKEDGKLRNKRLEKKR